MKLNSVLIVLLLHLITACTTKSAIKKSVKEPENPVLFDSVTTLAVSETAVYLNGQNIYSLGDLTKGSKEEFMNDTTSLLDSALLKEHTSYVFEDVINGMVMISLQETDPRGDSVVISVNDESDWKTVYRLMTVCGRRGFTRIALAVDSTVIASALLPKSNALYDSTLLNMVVAVEDSVVEIEVSDDHAGTILFDHRDSGNFVYYNGWSEYAWYDDKTGGLLTTSEGALLEDSPEIGVSYRAVATVPVSDTLPLISALVYDEEPVVSRNRLKAEYDLVNKLALIHEKESSAEDRDQVLFASLPHLKMKMLRGYIESLTGMGITNFSFAMFRK